MSGMEGVSGGEPIWDYDAKTLAWDLGGHLATELAPASRSCCSLR
jgi:hypothetical protein